MKYLKDNITVDKPQTKEEHDAAQNSLLAVLMEQAGDDVDIVWKDEGGKRTYHAQVVTMPTDDWVDMADKIEDIESKIDAAIQGIDEGEG